MEDNTVSFLFLFFGWSINATACVSYTPLNYIGPTHHKMKTILAYSSGTGMPIYSVSEKS